MYTYLTCAGPYELSLLDVCLIHLAAIRIKVGTWGTRIRVGSSSFQTFTDALPSFPGGRVGYESESGLGATVGQRHRPVQNCGPFSMHQA